MKKKNMEFNIEEIGNSFKKLAESITDFIQVSNKVHIYDVKFLSTNIYSPDDENECNTLANALVEFRIKELKDWVFGMWFDYDKGLWLDYDNGDGNYRVFLFAQVEDYIDKFRPSYSSFVEDGYIPGDSLDNIVNKSNDIDAKKHPRMDLPVIYYEIYDMIKYMKENKTLAWYKDVSYTDYNRTYMTRLNARLLKNKILFKKWRETKIGNYILKRKIKLVEKYILPLFNGGYLKYLGDCIYPSYEIRVPLSEAKEQFGITRKGNYGILNEEIDEKYFVKVGKLENLEFKLIGLVRNTNEVEDSSFYVYNDKG